jgi:hypothetical protein
MLSHPYFRSFANVSEKAAAREPPNRPAPPRFDVPLLRVARHVFEAAKLPGKFIIAFIIAKTARQPTADDLFARARFNPPRVLFRE